MLMKKKLMTYSAPQTCCEAVEGDFGLCQASASDFEIPTSVDDLTWSD